MQETHKDMAKSTIRGGDCGDYDYNDLYDIKHTGQLQQYLTNPGHSKLTSRSAVQFMQR